MTSLTNKPVAQHYVPQSYLRGFAKNKKDEFYLNVYDKENKTSFSSNVSNIGMENYFYSKDIAQLIETIFSYYEGWFNQALQKLKDNENLSKLNYIDKRIFSDFIAIQYLRTNETRMIIKESTERTFDIIGGHNLPGFVKGSVTLSEDSLKRFHLETILKSFQEISDIILNEMTWKLSINYTDTPFWTSDSPCAIYNELEPEPFRGNLGLKCKGFQMHFPLSTKLLLILMNQDIKIRDLVGAKSLKGRNSMINVLVNSPYSNLRVMDLLPEKEFVNEKRVMFENNLQVISSTRFIFSKTNDFKLADKYLGEYPHYKDKNRQRMIIN